MKGDLTFQPFGFRFELTSPIQPDVAKARIQNGMTGWFNPKTGPRGWIVGRVLCLWLNMYYNTGPIVIARISANGSQTRVSGRAGYGIFGSVLAASILLAIPIFAYASIANGAYLAGVLPLVAFSSLIAIGVLWLFHASRNEAQPLVRFLENSINSRGIHSGRPGLTKDYDDSPVSSAVLTVSCEEVSKEPSCSLLAESLRSLESDGFVIVSFGTQDFMQSALRLDRFVIEKRCGSADEHYYARGEFGLEDTTEIMVSYLRGDDPVQVPEWEKTY